MGCGDLGWVPEVSAVSHLAKARLAGKLLFKTLETWSKNLELEGHVTLGIFLEQLPT